MRNCPRCGADLRADHGMDVRWLVEKTGLSVLEISQEIGVSRQTVYTWLRGQKAPNGKNNAKLWSIYESIIPKNLSASKTAKKEGQQDPGDTIWPV